jgi:hypothetical protein
MKILIQFPTRNRPQKFFEVLDKYYNFLEDKENFFINISCDIDDESMNNDVVKDKIKKLKNTRIVYNQNKTKIEAINNGFSDLSYDIILLASDDMIPEIEGYDTIIRQNMIKKFPDTDGILWFNDGVQGSRLNTLCILGKKYYDRFGYIYNPEYKSLWSDNEFTTVGNLLKKQEYLNIIIIRHQHHSVNNLNTFDSLYQKNDTYHNQDMETFKKRSLKNFDLK